MPFEIFHHICLCIISVKISYMSLSEVLYMKYICISLVIHVIMHFKAVIQYSTFSLGNERLCVLKITLSKTLSAHLRAFINFMKLTNSNSGGKKGLHL